MDFHSFPQPPFFTQWQSDVEEVDANLTEDENDGCMDNTKISRPPLPLATVRSFGGVADHDRINLILSIGSSRSRTRAHDRRLPARFLALATDR
jgi:hypothetical protein